MFAGTELTQLLDGTTVNKVQSKFVFLCFCPSGYSTETDVIFSVTGSTENEMSIGPNRYLSELVSTIFANP